MRKKQKRLLLLLLLLIAIVAVVTIIIVATNGKNNNNEVASLNGNEEPLGEYEQKLEDGTKLNVSSKLNETKEVAGMQVGNIQLTNRNGITTLLADVTNNTGSDKGETLLTVKLLDAEGNELVSLDGIIEALQNGASAQLNMGVTADYANAYDFSIEVK